MPKFDDELLNTPVLRQRLVSEATMNGGNGSFRAMFRLPSNGNIHAVGVGATELAIDQRVFAEDMADVLNRNLSFGGAWIVGFTHPAVVSVLNVLALPEYGRWFFLWCDEDGDPQFSIENDDPFTHTLMKGPDWWIESAADAHASWKYHMRDVLELTPGQTYKRAQGERAQSLSKG